MIGRIWVTSRIWHARQCYANLGHHLHIARAAAQAMRDSSTEHPCKEVVEYFENPAVFQDVRTFLNRYLQKHGCEPLAAVGDAAVPFRPQSNMFPPRAPPPPPPQFAQAACGLAHVCAIRRCILWTGPPICPPRAR